MSVIFAASNNTGLQVISQQLDTESVEGRSNRRYLIKDIDAIPVFFDHALDPADLTGNTLDPTKDLAPSLILHILYTYTLYGYSQLADSAERLLVNSYH
jgi:hypothetical protein